MHATDSLCVYLVAMATRLFETPYKGWTKLSRGFTFEPQPGILRPLLFGILEGSLFLSKRNLQVTVDPSSWMKSEKDGRQTGCQRAPQGRQTRHKRFPSLLGLWMGPCYNIYDGVQSGLSLGCWGRGWVPMSTNWAFETNNRSPSAAARFVVSGGSLIWMPISCEFRCDWLWRDFFFLELVWNQGRQTLELATTVHWVMVHGSLRMDDNWMM